MNGESSNDHLMADTSDTIVLGESIQGISRSLIEGRNSLIRYTRLEKQDSGILDK